MNTRNLKTLQERARKLGRGVIYKYDHHAFNPCFRGNTHQFAITHNFGAKSYATLGEIETELSQLEKYSAAYEAACVNAIIGEK